MKTWIYKITDRYSLQGNAFLFCNILFLITISILFGTTTTGSIITRLLFNILILSSLFTIKRNKNLLFSLGVITIVSGHFFAWFFHYKHLNSITDFLKIIFFSVIVAKLVFQVMKSKNVDGKVIFESINVYLLISIIGSLIALIIMAYNPDAFVFNTAETHYFSDFFYFSIVTTTTLGYGDIIPASSAAKLLSMFLAIGGQLYLTIILALLIGKYLANKNKD